MDNATKLQISNDLRKYVENIAGGSANKASKMLQKVSGAYISHMLNGKWESISDDAWRNVQKQVCNTSGQWMPISTAASEKLSGLIADASIYANTFGIIGEAGTGKTYTAQQVASQGNIFLVCCNEYYNRKTFLSDLLQKMGKDGGGYTVAEMMQTVVSTLLKADRPAIILDEADKLSDQVLYFFISLYNQLQDKCGLILMATDHLEKRIDKGVKLNKKGYKEIYSRLGRKFISLPLPSRSDITNLIKANGISDEMAISKIFNTCDNDLRRVARLVHAEKQKGA